MKTIQKKSTGYKQENLKEEIKNELNTTGIEIGGGGGTSSSNVTILSGEAIDASVETIFIGTLTGGATEDSRSASEEEVEFFSKFDDLLNELEEKGTSSIPYIFLTSFPILLKVDFTMGSSCISASSIISSDLANSFAADAGMEPSFTNNFLFTITYMAFSETPTITYSFKELGAGGSSSSNGGSSEPKLIYSKTFDFIDGDLPQDGLSLEGFTPTENMQVTIKEIGHYPSEDMVAEYQYKSFSKTSLEQSGFSFVVYNSICEHSILGSISSLRNCAITYSGDTSGNTDSGWVLRLRDYIGNGNDKFNLNTKQFKTDNYSDSSGSHVLPMSYTIEVYDIGNVSGSSGSGSSIIDVYELPENPDPNTIYRVTTYGLFQMWSNFSFGNCIKYFNEMGIPTKIIGVSSLPQNPEETGMTSVTVYVCNDEVGVYYDGSWYMNEYFAALYAQLSQSDAYYGGFVPLNYSNYNYNYLYVYTYIDYYIGNKKIKIDLTDNDLIYSSVGIINTGDTVFTGKANFNALREIKIVARINYSDSDSGYVINFTNINNFPSVLFDAYAMCGVGSRLFLAQGNDNITISSPFAGESISFNNITLKIYGR